MDRHTPILIVGLGPVGLLASWLFSADVNVIAVDKRANYSRPQVVQLQEDVLFFLQQHVPRSVIQRLFAKAIRV